MLDHLKTAWKVATAIARGLWYALVVLTPLLGIWLASSLAAYLNGPTWLAALAGVLAFPALPLFWEAWSHRRHERKNEAREADGNEAREPWFSFGDRFILRTLVVNLVFLTMLASLFPQASFAALSTRGDWMLEGRDAPWTSTARTALFGAAGGLEWLYNLTRDNPYERWDDDEDQPTPSPVAGEVDRTRPKDDEAPSQIIDDSEPASPSPVTADRPEPRVDKTDTETRDAAPRWPLNAELHPAVTTIPPHQETSPESVARYLAANERDPHRRVKAIYDWIADHIRYDAPALAAGDYPPQDPETVFETRKAVCAGYAKLFERMTETVGIESVYITGVSRDRGGNVGGSGHAWNAVEIDGRWYLLDATWGAGYVENDTFHKRYNPDYLFTPPRVLGVDHFPDKARWQLREDPLSRGEFMRQPMLKAGFFKRDFRLQSPRRSQVTVDDRVDIMLDRPAGQHVLASLYNAEGKRQNRCDVDGDRRVHVRCDIPRRGGYEVRLFGNDARAGEYDFVGQIQVRAR
ncbi:MAG: transglutaminase domain-containing protein [Myxococcota bacterium]